MEIISKSFKTHIISLINKFNYISSVKILKIILINILLVNIAYPCADLHELSQKDSTELSSFEMSDCNEQNEMDECSPFCVCECCAISTIVEKINSVNIILENIPNNVHYHNWNPNLDPNLVFQPPQILI